MYLPQPIQGPDGRAIYPTTVTPQQQEAAREVEAARVRAAVERRQREDAERARQRAEAAREAGRQELAAHEEACRRAFLSSGGTESEFVRAWPSLRARYLEEKTLEGLTQRERAVEAQKARLRGLPEYQL
jgi:hypothetical protein